MDFNKKDDIKKIEEFLIGKFGYQGQKVHQNEILPVIDILEHLSEVLRFHHDYFSHSISYEDFLNGEVTVSDETFNFMQLSGAHGFNSGTPPLALQPQLLLFLLYYRKEIPKYIRRYMQATGR